MHFVHFVHFDTFCAVCASNEDVRSDKILFGCWSLKNCGWLVGRRSLLVERRLSFQISNFRFQIEIFERLPIRGFGVHRLWSKRAVLRFVHSWRHSSVVNFASPLRLRSCLKTQRRTSDFSLITYFGTVEARDACPIADSEWDKDRGFGRPCFTENGRKMAESDKSCKHNLQKRRFLFRFVPVVLFRAERNKHRGFVGGKPPPRCL